MRILHITPYYPPAWSFGGVVTAVHGLATEQARQGHQVTILTTTALDSQKQTTTTYEILDGVEVYRATHLIYPFRTKLNLSTPIGMRQIFQNIVQSKTQKGIDVIHLHELRTVEALMIPHTPRIPIILSPHGTLSHLTGRSKFKQGWDRFLGGSIMRRIDHIVALTATEAAESSDLWSSVGLLPPPISIIPNGVSDAFGESLRSVGNLRAKYQLGDGVVTLFLGRLQERKGVQFLIPAFAKATEFLPDARLLTVGPDEGMLAQLQSQVASLGIADRVVFTGLLSGVERLAVFNTADLFVLPAVGEGLSMAALEALAAGLPLILTPGCNLPELDVMGAGITVPREVDRLAAAMHELITDPIRRKTMGEVGRTWANRDFTWPVISRNMVEKYAEVIAYAH